MKQQSKVHLYYLIILLLFVFSGYFIPLSWYENTYFELFFSQVGLLMIPTVIFLLLNREQLHVYLPLKKLAFRDMLFMPFLVMPLIFIGSFLNSLLIFLVSSWHGPVYTPTYSVDTTLSILPYILGMAILPGILEEAVHRGILLGTYQKQGKRFAMFTSAFLFALLHLSIANLGNTFMLGLFFAWLVFFTGSLYSSMYAHFLYNLFILISEYVIPIDELPEYLSISLMELLDMIPITIIILIVWIWVLHFYKKGHPEVPLETRREAASSFGQLLLTDRLFTLCLLFVFSVYGFLLFL